MVRGTAPLPGMCTSKHAYSLVGVLAAGQIPVKATYQEVGFAERALSGGRDDAEGRDDRESAHLTNAAVNVHRDDPAFVSRLMADDLWTSALC